MRIALVGLGGMGTVHHTNYQYIEEAQVVVLVGRGEADERRAKEWKLPLYATITEALAHVDVDLVDICAPTFLHKELALESLRLRKHTITEKPIALRLADAREMYETAERNGVQLYVAHVVQFSREVEVLREVTREKRYGEPLDASFLRLTACPDWVQGSWLFEKEKSGVLPYDLHIHDLDVIVSLFGEPKEARYTSCGGKGKHYREQYRFTYFFDTLHVNAEASWFNVDIPFTAQWRVYYENGLLW
ncbi:MAG: Gfo/Idh/MocA family oxidoreductase, partial [Clostridia bacterium]